VVLNLAPPNEDDDKGKTRDKVAEAIGVNRNTLETIRVIGELAEIGGAVVEKSLETKEESPASIPVRSEDTEEDEDDDFMPEDSDYEEEPYEEFEPEDSEQEEQFEQISELEVVAAQVSINSKK
jgi:hypothetical protein